MRVTPSLRLRRILVREDIITPKRVQGLVGFISFDAAHEYLYRYRVVPVLQYRKLCALRDRGRGRRAAGGLVPLKRIQRTSRGVKSSHGYEPRRCSSSWFDHIC